MGLRRSVRVLWFTFKTTLQTRFEYRVDLMMGLLGSFGWQAAGLATLWVVLFQKQGDLAGWSPAQIGLIFGLTGMVQGCSELCFNHIWWTPVYVIRGQFDRLLVYPVPQLPFFLISSPELHAFGNLGVGLAIFSACLRHLGLSHGYLAALPYWVVCGSLVHSSLLVLAGSLVLRIKGNAHQFFWLTNAVLSNSRYPLPVYPGWVQGLLLLAVPIATANFIPASAVLGRIPLWQGLLFPGLAAAVMVSLAWTAWERSMQHYESSGS
jgi:ABC-2 type transport system permease protein